MALCRVGGATESQVQVGNGSGKILTRLRYIDYRCKVVGGIKREHVVYCRIVATFNSQARRERAVLINASIFGAVIVPWPPWIVDCDQSIHRSQAGSEYRNFRAKNQIGKCSPGAKQAEYSNHGEY